MLNEGDTYRVGWKSIDSMTRIEQKMFWSVAEETMLHELPRPEVDAPDHPSEVRWPAEDPDDCSAVLLDWFDQGLITVATTWEHNDLAPSEARALLASPLSWTPEHSVVFTDHGQRILGPTGVPRGPATSPLPTDAELSAAWADLKSDCGCPDIYFCRSSREIECPRHSGFDVCCDRVDEHIPVR